MIEVTNEDGVWCVTWPDHTAGAMFGSEEEARQHADWLTAIMKMTALIPGARVYPSGRDVEDLEMEMPGIGSIDLSGFTMEVQNDA